MTQRRLDELDEKEMAELVELARIAEEKARIMSEAFTELALKYERRLAARRPVAQKSQ